MTSAIDELLTLLKEHGAEHYEHEAPATDCIAFFDGDGWHDCWESVAGEVNVTFSMTPEQAIAATLGTTDANPTQAESSGTCHDESSIIVTQAPTAEGESSNEHHGRAEGVRKQI